MMAVRPAVTELLMITLINFTLFVGVSNNKFRSTLTDFVRKLKQNITHDCL